MRTHLVRHPAPLLGIARRGSSVQAFHERIETPVTLAEADPDEFVPAVRVADLCKGLGAFVEMELVTRDGGTWVCLPGQDGMDPADVLTAFMEGRDIDWRTNAMLTSIFAGTPLVAALRNDVTTLTRGSDVAGSLRGVEEFDQDRARAGLVDFLAARVALAGRAAFARVCAPVACRSRFDVYEVVAFARARDQRHHDHLCDPSDIGRDFAWFSTRPTLARGEAEVMALYRPRLTLNQDAVGCPGDGADAWAEACEAPQDALRRLRSAPRGLTLALAGQVPALRRDAAWGTVGGIGADEGLGVLGRVESLLDGIARQMPRSEAADMLLRVRDWTAPRFAEVAGRTARDGLGEEDEAALEGVAAWAP